MSTLKASFNNTFAYQMDSEIGGSMSVLKGRIGSERVNGAAHIFGREILQAPSQDLLITIIHRRCVVGIQPLVDVKILVDARGERKHVKRERGVA